MPEISTPLPEGAAQETIQPPNAENLNSPEAARVTEAWNILNNKAAERQSPHKRENESRSQHLSLQDRIRRQSLLLQARVERISNLDTFQSLVDYVESTFTETESKFYWVKRGLSEEEKKLKSRPWRVRGYEVSFYDYEKRKRTSMNLRRDVPFKVGRADVKNLKKLISSDNNPIELINELQKVGFHLFGSNFRADGDMDKLGQFFRSPHVSEVLDLVQTITNWDSDLFRAYDNLPVNIDFLIRLAQNPDPKSVLSPETAQKIDVLSRAFNLPISATNIEELQTVINNPDYLEFSACISQMFDYSNSRPARLLDGLNALNNANLLQPLLTLYRLDINDKGAYPYSPGPIFTKLGELFNGPDANPDGLRSLQETLSRPGIKDLVQSSYNQQLVKGFKELGVSFTLEDLTNIDINNLNALRETVTFLLKAPDRDENVGIKEILDILNKEPELVKVFRDAEFKSFLETLTVKTGYTPKFSDFWDGESRLVTNLFKYYASDRGQIFEESTLAVARTVEGDGRFRLDHTIQYINLAKIPNIISAINLIRELEPNSTGEAVFKHGGTAAAIAEFLTTVDEGEFRNLIRRISSEFNCAFSLTDFFSVKKIYENNLQNEIFKSENVNFIKKIRPNGLYDLDQIVQMLDLDSTHRILLVELVDKFNYLPFFGERGIHEQEVLEELLVNPQLREALLSERTVGIIRRLQEEFNYGNIRLRDYQYFITLPDNFVDFIAELQQRYGYEFKREDLSNLAQLASNREQIPFVVIGELNNVFGHHFSMDFGNSYAKLMKIPNIVEKIRQAGSLIEKGGLEGDHNLQLLAILGAEGTLYNHAKRLMSDDYFINIRDAQNRMNQFKNLMYEDNLPDTVIARVFALSQKATELDQLALKIGINLETAKAADKNDWYIPLLQASSFQEANEIMTRQMTELALRVVYSDLEGEDFLDKQKELVTLASQDREFEDTLEIGCRSVGIYGQEYPNDHSAYITLMGAIRQALELNLERNPAAYAKKRAELSMHQFDRIFSSFPEDVRQRVTHAWLDFSPRRRLRINGEVITSEEATLSRLNRLRDVVRTDLSVHLQRLFEAKIQGLEIEGEASGLDVEQLAIYRQYLLTPEGTVRQDIPNVYGAIERYIHSAQQTLKDPEASKEQKGKLGKSLGIYQAISDSLKALYRLGTISEERYKGRRDYLNELDKNIGGFSSALKRLRLLDPEKRSANVNMRALEEEVLLDFGKLRETMSEEGIEGQAVIETQSTVSFRDLAKAPEMTQSCQRLTEVTGFNYAAYSRLLDGSNEMIDIFEMRNGEKNRVARNFIELSKASIEGEVDERLVVLLDREYVNPQYQNFSNQFAAEMVAHMLDRINEVPEVSLLFDSYRIGKTPEIDELLAARGYKIRQVTGNYFVNESNVKFSKYYDSLGGIVVVYQPTSRRFYEFFLIEKAA